MSTKKPLPSSKPTSTATASGSKATSARSTARDSNPNSSQKPNQSDEAETKQNIAQATLDFYGLPIDTDSVQAVNPRKTESASKPNTLTPTPALSNPPPSSKTASVRAASAEKKVSTEELAKPSSKRTPRTADMTSDAFPSKSEPRLSGASEPKTTISSAVSNANHGTNDKVGGNSDDDNYFGEDGDEEYYEEDDDDVVDEENDEENGDFSDPEADVDNGKVQKAMERLKLEEEERSTCIEESKRIRAHMSLLSENATHLQQTANGLLDKLRVLEEQSRIKQIEFETRMANALIIGSRLRVRGSDSQERTIDLGRPKSSRSTSRNEAERITNSEAAPLVGSSLRKPSLPGISRNPSLSALDSESPLRESLPPTENADSSKPPSRSKPPISSSLKSDATNTKTQTIKQEVPNAKVLTSARKSPSPVRSQGSSERASTGSK